MTKIWYASRYDKMAPSLYRFALLSIGDAERAQEAVCRTFEKGLDCYDEENFFSIMLGLLWSCCKEQMSSDQGRYLSNLGPVVKDVSLLAALSKMDSEERGRLLLKLLFGCNDNQSFEIIFCSSNT